MATAHVCSSASPPKPKAGRAQLTRTTESRGSAGKPLLACFDLNKNFFSSTAASEVYVSFGRKSEIERMFMKTIIYSPDKNGSSSCDTTRSGNSGKC